MPGNIMSRRNVLSLLFFAPYLYAQSLDKERVWQDFFNWLKNTSIGDVYGIGGLFRKYRAKLVADGYDEEQISQRISVIGEFMLSGTEGMKTWFNKVYTTREDFFSQRPNAFLAQAIEGVKPGIALDIAMGQGRNSIYLAQMGWDVTGFDVSDEALSIASRNAEKAGVTIKTILSGYQDFNFGKNRWDLVVLSYAFFPIRDAGYIRKLKDSIRPGGILVFEHFLSAASGPQNLDGMLGMPRSNELLKTFNDFRVLRYEEVVMDPDWLADRPKAVVRLLAKKN